MKIKIVFLLMVTLCLPFVLSAQEQIQKYVGVEAGITFISGNMSEMDFIRSDIPDYSDYYAPSYLKSFMNRNFVGVKSEFFTLSDKFGISGGLRFSWYNSSVGRNTYWAGNTDYFYLFLRQDGLNTEYLKVKELLQKTNYFEIPLEVRFFPYRAPLIRAYVKLGLDLGIKVQSRTEVEFYDEKMDPFAEDVALMIKNPASFNAAVSASTGVRIGRKAKPAVSIEACLLSLYLASEKSGLVDPVYGGGLQLNLQIPLKSIVK